MISPRYGRLLGDFTVGATYRHPWEVTIDDGLVALCYASFQDAMPLFASEAQAKALGFAKRPLHPHLTLNLALSFSVHDVSEQAIAHLAYVDVRFPDAGFVGDTVTARSTVIEARPASSGDKGVVHVRTVLETTDGRVLCAFERKALIRAGTMPEHAGENFTREEPTPKLDALKACPDEITRPRERVHSRAGRLFGLFEEFSVGQTFAHGLGKTVGTSEHMQLTTLLRNSHPLHFDEVYAAQSSFTKHRVVYGGLVFAWVCAMASRDVAGNALWDLRYQAGAHPASVSAGDTLYAASRVTAIEDRGPVGAVTFSLVGVKNTTARAALEKHGDTLFGSELGKKENKIGEKVFEIARTLLVRKR